MRHGMNGYYQQLVALLKAHGFLFVRAGKGSHEIWGKGNIHLTVPYNCKSRYTANAILKDAGVNKRL
jgi:predicted RNA binding protein YcfA (HicA-like mRNA interferase family)